MYCIEFPGLARWANTISPFRLSPNERNNGLSLRESPYTRSIRGCEKIEPVGREWIVEVFVALVLTGLAKGAVRETVVRMNDGNGCK